MKLSRDLSTVKSAIGKSVNRVGFTLDLEAGGCGAGVDREGVEVGLLSAIAIQPHDCTMAGVTWHYVLKFIITGESAQSVCLGRFRGADRACDRSVGDAAVGKSSLLIRLTDQRFLANPDPTVRTECALSLVSHELLLAPARSRIRVETNYDSGRREGGQTSMCVPLLPRCSSALTALGV